MVVGDDHLQPDAVRIAHLVDRSDAAIHRHHQPGAVLPQAPEGWLVQPIGLAKAVGDVGLHLGPQLLKGVHQQDRGADAVGVEIAIDDDGLAAAQGLAQAGDSGGHARHLEGIAQGAAPGEEIGELGRTELARIEHPGQHRIGQGRGVVETQRRPLLCEEPADIGYGLGRFAAPEAPSLRAGHGILPSP